MNILPEILLYDNWLKKVKHLYEVEVCEECEGSGFEIEYDNIWLWCKGVNNTLALENRCDICNGSGEVIKDKYLSFKSEYNRLLNKELILWKVCYGETKKT